MSFKVEKTKNANEAKLEITVEAEKFNDAIKKVYFQSAKYFNIPGFRKGKAPQNIVEKYYGKEIFYEDAFNDIAKVELEKAVKDSKLEVVSNPQIDIVKMEKGQDLVFTAIFSIKPEAQLKKYKGIEIEKIEYNVEEKDIEEELKKMQEKNARMISVETPVESGNTVLIDFDGFIDGKRFEGGKAENHNLVIGSNSFIPGFEDQIIGMKLEEEKDVKVTFPKEYYVKDLAGKDAVFKVKVHEIKKKELPELDDEFAKDVSEFDTLEELKNSLKEKLEKENKYKEKYEKQEAIIKELIKELEVEIPNGMIEWEIDNMMQNMERRVNNQGLEFEQYLKMVNLKEDDLREEYRPQAIHAIKSRLALEEVIKKENIELTEEEIKEKVKEMAKNYGQEEDYIEKDESIMNFIKEGAKNEKALDFLLANSKVKK